MNARKAHNTGRNHVANVRDYFMSLGTDRAQNMIDQIITQHEGGGRAMMMNAPSMRLGAGFMNPVATGPGFQGGPPPFQQGAPGFRPPYPPQQQFPVGGARPPFPPQGMPNGGFSGAPGGAPPFRPPMGMGGPGGPPAMPPFAPNGAAPPFPPNGAGASGMPPFPPGAGAPPPQFSASIPFRPPGGGGAPGPAGSPAGAGGAAGPGPGVHPDRLRMMGQA